MDKSSKLLPPCAQYSYLPQRDIYLNRLSVTCSGLSAPAAPVPQQFSLSQNKLVTATAGYQETGWRTFSSTRR